MRLAISICSKLHRSYPARWDYRKKLDNSLSISGSLLQDIFDVILIAPATPGFAADTEITAQLRALFADGRDIPVLLADTRTGSAAINADNSEYNGVIAKPYDKDAIAEKIARFNWGWGERSTAFWCGLKGAL